MADSTNDIDIEKKYDFLYPLIENPRFNIKISEQRQFWDTRYPQEPIHDVKAQSNFICHEREFELLPHQMFVRNYLSSQTPYNSLLLYHGLGTGKTCSAISVGEMYRSYQKQTNNNKKIWIIASPNVKENFKLQLFDHRKLEKINGVWNLRACTGNTYLSEINPLNIKNLSKDLIIGEVNKIIKNAYNFIGYTEFSNLIEKILKQSKSERKQNRLLKNKFSDSLIVIDEVHNIRHSTDNPHKKVAIHLLKVIKNTLNLKLLFLSATPMYNNSEEIVWLLNMMNINDGRPPVEKSHIFEAGGHLNEENLIASSIGYISYLRGENPYTFPYRIWPHDFEKRNSLIELEKKGKFYPTKQINGGDILEPIQHLDLFMVTLNKYQATGYKAISQKIKEKLPKHHTEKTGLGYEALGDAIQGLNFIYPYTLPISNVEQLYGKKGLTHVMKFNEKKRKNFSYRAATKKKYGSIFSQENIHKYSAKIARLTDTISHSTGIILIYSRYLDGGCIPIALALEEMGITRYGRASLFKNPPHPAVSYDTLKTKKTATFLPAKYAMITGDVQLSPNKNKLEMNAITDKKNINGELVKVVIITRAGAEGLDFKNIRQVHILEPWYNLNRSEQVIGRAVRNCSHKDLPFAQRNVEIYLYGTKITRHHNEECADLYIYRKAEQKAKKIGVVSRILKENSVDCILNQHYNNLSINKIEKQQLSSKKTPIEFNIKSKSYSSLCDYMKECHYSCNPDKNITEDDINDDTYNEIFIIMNMDKIIHRIQMLMKEQFIYTKQDLIARIRANKHYPLMQINSALSKLVNDKNQYVTDMFGRIGHLVNIDSYYMFQPIEIDNEHIDRYERSHDLDQKPDKIIIKITPPESKTPPKSSILTEIKNIYECATRNEDCENEWAKHMYPIFQMLLNDPFNIPEPNLKTFICEHIFDSLSFHHKLTVLNYIWTKKKGFYRFIKQVIETRFVLKGGQYNIVPVIESEISKKRVGKSLYIYKDNQWQVPTKADLISGGYKNIIKNHSEKNNLDNIFGFMGRDKTHHIKFKMMNKTNMIKRKHKGFQCITQQKHKTQTLLNKLMEYSPLDAWRNIQFTLTDAVSDNQIAIQRGFSRGKLCNLSEMILRWYNEQEEDKTWFLSSFETLYNKIEK